MDPFLPYFSSSKLERLYLACPTSPLDFTLAAPFVRICLFSSIQLSHPNLYEFFQFLLFHLRLGQLLNAEKFYSNDYTLRIREIICLSLIRKLLYRTFIRKNHENRFYLCVEIFPFLFFFWKSYIHGIVEKYRFVIVTSGSIQFFFPPPVIEKSWRTDTQRWGEFLFFQSRLRIWIGKEWWNEPRDSEFSISANFFKNARERKKRQTLCTRRQLLWSVVLHASKVCVHIRTWHFSI